MLIKVQALEDSELPHKLGKSIKVAVWLANEEVVNGCAQWEVRYVQDFTTFAALASETCESATSTLDCITSVMNTSSQTLPYGDICYERAVNCVGFKEVVVNPARRNDRSCKA